MKHVVSLNNWASAKPVITVGILVPLLGFRVSKVEFVDKFKLMEDMFSLNWPLGRFSHRVVMSVCLCVCVCVCVSVTP